MIYFYLHFEVECNGQRILQFSIAKKSYNTKKIAGKILSDIFTADDFETSFRDRRSSIGTPLGSHSLQKYPSTHIRCNGCSCDEIDLRDRWKHLKR